MARPKKSPELREHQHAQRMLENRVKELEADAKRLIESADVFNPKLLMPWDQYMDGNRLLFPSGFPSDRKAGQDWPIIKDDNDVRSIRSFSRLLCETNPYALGFRDHVRNYVVGHGFEWETVLAGIRPGASAGITDRDGDGKPDVDPDVEACQQVLDEFRRLNYWGESGEVRVNQSLNDPTMVGHNRERECYERAMEDGVVHLRLFLGDQQSQGIPYARQTEPECIITPPGESVSGPWSFGIKTYQDVAGNTDVERVEAYHVADPYRPGALGDIVPAAHIVTMKLNTKASVKVGMPDFYPIGDELQGSSTLVKNMLKVSGILSAIAYIRQHAPTTTADQVTRFIQNQATGSSPLPVNTRTPYGPPGADATRYLTAHQAGMIIDIANQLQYEPGPVNSGVPGFILAQQATLRCIGLRWGCPEYFSGDASNANFASTLVSGGPFERATLVRQGEFKIFQQNLAVRVLMFAVAAGRLTQAQIAKVAVKVKTPPVVISDRNADTQRRAILFDKAGLSQQTWLSEEGYDHSHESANRNLSTKIPAK